MTKPTNRDALRRELVRLLAGLEFYRTWAIVAIERDKGQVSQSDLNQIVMPAAEFLQIFDDTKGARCAHILRDVQLWYAQTAGDLFHFEKTADPKFAADIRQFFDDFRQHTGFDFYAEAGLLKKIASQTLKTGKIATPQDYDALKELENTVDQPVLEPAEMVQIAALLRKFETANALPDRTG